MRRLCFVLLAANAHAAVIRGAVSEHNTGNALARTQITLQPVGSAAQAVLSMRTNESGNFEFASLAAGAYIVKASRRAFLPLEYGQRQWNSAGTPVVVAADGVAFLNLRLHRPGAVSGVVRDDNEIGMAGHEVVAYRNTQPPQLVAHATTDDRGVYRIFGLEPGIYLVRTTGKEDHFSYIPTFAKQTLRVEDARPVQVYADEDTGDVDVHPAQGRLFRVSGGMDLPDGSSISITLASDMGRRTTTSPFFDFRGLPPGEYELYAEGFAGPPVNKAVGAYTQFTLNKDLTEFSLSPREIRDMFFDISPRQTTRNSAVQVFSRRKDLAGVGPAEPLTLKDNRAPVAPGRWEFMATPPAGQYVTQFVPGGRRNTRPDGWNEVTVQFVASVRIGTSGGASALHGIVRTGNEAVEGAPVFLEAWDPDERRRLLELRSVRTGSDGTFRFESVAPGVYRVMSSFEYLSPDPIAMELGGSKIIKIEAHTDPQMEIDLYGIR